MILFSDQSSFPNQSLYNIPNFTCSKHYPSFYIVPYQTPFGIAHTATPINSYPFYQSHSQRILIDYSAIIFPPNICVFYCSLLNPTILFTVFCFYILHKRFQHFLPLTLDKRLVVPRYPTLSPYLSSEVTFTPL